jgi:hypothetical protein
MVSVDVVTELDWPMGRSCERGGKSVWSSDAGEFSVGEQSGLLRGVVDVYDRGRRSNGAFGDAGDWRCGAGWIDDGLCDLKTGS